MDGGKENSLISSTSGKSQLIWNDHPQPLTEILEECTLPIVAKLYTDKETTGSEQNGSFDIYQPLLIYKEVSGKKLYARNVTGDALTDVHNNGDGHVVVIPTNYKGWFQLADDKDRPMTTISNIARIMPMRFLSSKLVSGFVALRGGGKRSDYLHQKVQIQPGVFHVRNIYEDFVRYIDKNVTKRKLLRCLRCCLDDGTDVLLPFDSEGCFYLIEVKTSVSKHQNLNDVAFVYNISDMISAGMTKDVVIKLVHGRPPKKQCGFTSFLQVCDLIKDQTIVACTLNKEKRLLELPLSPFPMFVKALNDTDLLTSNPLFAETFLYMETEADEYTIEMKVRYNYTVNNEWDIAKETTQEDTNEMEESVNIHRDEDNEDRKQDESEKQTDLNGEETEEDEENSEDETTKL